jgi:hypothetical protein
LLLFLGWPIIRDIKCSNPEKDKPATSRIMELLEYHPESASTFVVLYPVSGKGKSTLCFDLPTTSARTRFHAGREYSTPYLVDGRFLLALWMAFYHKSSPSVERMLSDKESSSLSGRPSERTLFDIISFHAGERIRLLWLALLLLLLLAFCCCNTSSTSTSSVE